MPTVKMRFDLIPLALHGDGDPVDDLGPELLQIAADNARAQAAEVLMAQRARELWECSERFRKAREQSYAGDRREPRLSKGVPSPPQGQSDDRDLRHQNAGGAHEFVEDDLAESKDERER